AEEMLVGQHRERSGTGFFVILRDLHRVKILAEQSLAGRFPLELGNDREGLRRFQQGLGQGKRPSWNIPDLLLEIFETPLPFLLRQFFQFVVVDLLQDHGDRLSFSRVSRAAPLSIASLANTAPCFRSLAFPATTKAAAAFNTIPSRIGPKKVF